MTDKYLLPALFVLLSALVAAFVLATGRLRRENRDTGDLWANVLRTWGSVIAILALVSCAIAPSWDGFWKTGIHLQIDRVFPESYRAALFAPLPLWVLVMLWFAVRKPKPSAEAQRTGLRPPVDAARWVAGGIGFSPSRSWILVAAATLALVLVTTASLGGGEYAYPGALWGSLATLVVTLAAFAASRGVPPREPAAVPEKAASTEPALALPPWPEALREQGVQVEPMLPLDVSGNPTVFPGRPEAPRTSPGAPHPLGKAAQEVTDCLFQSVGTSRERSCLLLVPDDMGQVELVVELSKALLEQARETTLVVVPSDPDLLLGQFARRLGAGTRFDVMRPGRVLGGADFWVVDADTLSDSLLPRLGDESALSRLGLVVWWEAHAYTGVLAANMWAISRRLDRLIRANGREDVRTLAIMRSTPDPGAQLGRYVRRLFPHDMKEITVASAVSRDVAPYRVVSHVDFFDGHRDAGIPPAVRHPGLIAGLASMRAGFSTYVDGPPGTGRSEREAFVRLDVMGQSVGASAVATPSEASIAVRHIRAVDALAFPEIVRGTGRATSVLRTPMQLRSGPKASTSGNSTRAPVYVGIVAPPNPYARYVLSARFPPSARAASRRLVCSEGRPRIIERHLLLALAEMPDSRSNLRSTALWNEGAVQTTLDRLAKENALLSAETRRLGKDGRLQMDRVYRSLKSLPEHVRPLDTSGTEPVLVREVSAKDGGIRRMIDKERLPIVAYPQCAFVSGGMRYEVRDWDWDTLEGAKEPKWIECQVQDKHRVTWRRRDVRLAEITPTKAPVRAAQSGHALVRQPADVVYEEIVRGVHMLVFEGGADKKQRITFQKPIRTRFETQALLLELPVTQDHVALASVAQALRHVLPVHLGVEEDAVEVVSLPDGARGRVAIVDLFPGGMGVVQPILDDDDFLLTLLGRCHDWLAACPCRDPIGCAECLRSEEASAANPDDAHRRDAALGVLSRMVPRGSSGGG